MSKYQAYPEYKDSGVEWLDKVPSHWNSVPIKYMALEPGSLFLDGNWIESKDISGDEIRYITTGNVGEGCYKEQGTGYITEEKFQQLNCTEVFEGDILISRLNEPIGRSCIVPNLRSRIVTSVDNVIFRADKKYNKKYIVHLFSSTDYFKHTSNLARGATMQRISRGLLGNIRVVAPTIDEQGKIANFLDHETAKIDTLIDKQQQLIQLLKEKRQAVISHAVTKGLNPKAPMRDSGVEWLGEVPEHWEVGNLRWFIEIASGEGLSNTEIESSENEEFEFRVVGGNGTMGFTKKTNTTEQAFAIGRVGALCGNVHFIDESCWVTDNALKISYWKNYNNKYLYFLLTAANLNDYASRSAQPLITGEQVKALKCPIPPINEQIKIGRHIQSELSKFAMLILKNEQAVSLAKERRTALISAAVTGKIDVRSWVAPSTLSRNIRE